MCNYLHIYKQWSDRGITHPGVRDLDATAAAVESFVPHAPTRRRAVVARAGAVDAMRTRDSRTHRAPTPVDARSMGADARGGKVRRRRNVDANARARAEVGTATREDDGNDVRDRSAGRRRGEGRGGG